MRRAYVRECGKTTMHGAHDTRTNNDEVSAVYFAIWRFRRDVGTTILRDAASIRRHVAPIDRRPNSVRARFVG
jgi:hypothetical protein